MTILIPNRAKGGSALFVLPSDTMGGAERVAAMLAEEAARSGQFGQVTVYVMCYEPLGSLEYLKEIPGCNIIVVYGRARREAFGISGFVCFVLGKKFDFVFTTHTHVNAMCAFLRRIYLLRTNRLVTRESTMIFDYDFGWATNKVVGFLNIFYGSQDIIICQTRLMANRYNKNTNSRLMSKIRLIPNPISQRRMQKDLSVSIASTLLPQTRGPKIVWCGRFIDSKRPLLAIQTLASLHGLGHKDAKLIMIGDGPLLSSAVEEIKRLQLQDSVCLMGFQSNPISIMAHCDYGLLTSNVEGFPNVILEMLTAGVKRVVTTNCAGDLDTVPGVVVSQKMEALTLAKDLASVLKLPRHKEVDAHLATRDISLFLTKLL